MRTLLIFTCTIFLTGKSFSQGCFGKSDFARIQKSTLPEAKSYLRNFFYNATVNEFSGSVPVCAEEKIAATLGLKEMGFAGACYSTWQNENCFVLYQFKNYAPIYLYESEEDCYFELLYDCQSALKGVKTGATESYSFVVFPIAQYSLEFREYYNVENSYRVVLYNKSQLQILLNQQHVKFAAVLKDGDVLFSKNEFELAKLKYLAAQEIEDNDVLLSKIKLCDEALVTILKKKYDEAIQEGDGLFLAMKYDFAKLKYLAAKDIENTQFIKLKIEGCEKAICDLIISRGDVFFNDGEYENALLEFEEAKNCSKSTSSLTEKIKMTERKIMEIKINNFQTKGEDYITARNYDLALDQYREILKLDNSNALAKGKIEQVEIIKDFLFKRSTTVFPYRVTNKMDFNSFQNYLLKDINALTKKNKQGFLNYNCLIAFDTLGNNLTAIKNISSSLSDYATSLPTLAWSGILKPSGEGGYFLASSDTLSFDAKWNTAKYSYKSTSKGLVQKNLQQQNLSSVANFIAKQQYNYGKYHVVVKNKEFNNQSYADINLVKYKTVGPEATFLSLLMPGMGTLKVTYGQKGWGRFTWFLLSSGVAAGAKYYSDDQYAKYMGATNQTDIDIFYEKANLSNKIALVAAGLSATIYVSDIIWVFTKGVKNKKSSKLLRKQLKLGPVQIQNQSISWQ